MNLKDERDHKDGHLSENMSLLDHHVRKRRKDIFTNFYTENVKFSTNFFTEQKNLVFLEIFDIEQYRDKAIYMEFFRFFGSSGL